MPEANALSAMGAYSRNERHYLGRNAAVSERAPPREPAATDYGAEDAEVTEKNLVFLTSVRSVISVANFFVMCSKKKNPATGAGFMFILLVAG